MKLRVLRSLPAAPAGGPLPRRLPRLAVDPDGLALGPPAGRRGWDSLRAAAVFRGGGEAAPQVLLLLAELGARIIALEDIDVTALDDGGDRAAPTAADGETARRTLRLLCRRRPGLAIDRATYEFMRGAAPARVADLGIHAARLEAAVARLASRRRARRRQDRAAAPAAEVVCPHCGHTQAPAKTCARCGAIFAKLARLGHDPPTGAGAEAREDDPAYETAGDLPGAPIEPLSRWGEPFLAADSLGTLIRDAFGRHGRPLVMASAGPLLAGVVAASAAWRWLPPAYALPAVALLALAAAVIAVLAVAVYLHDAVEARAPSLRGALATALRRAPAAIAHRLLATLHVALGLAALVLPGAVLALRYAFLETVYATAPREGPPPPISSGQVSRNLSDGFGLSVAVLLIAGDAVAAAVLAFPLYLAWLGHTLALVTLPAWPPGAGFALLTAVVYAGLGGAVLSLRTALRYFLFRELSDQQGGGIYAEREGASRLTKAVLLFDLVLLVLVLIRASALDS